MESWKPVEGYEGLYEVSDLGRVRSIKRSGRILAGCQVAHGYIAVSLHKNNQKSMYLVHRLVAKAFIPNPENKSQVNHKDLDKRHNSVENLEWVTPRENIEHALVHKPFSDRQNPWKVCFPEQKPNCTTDLWQSNLMKIRVEKGLTREQLAAKSCVRIDTIEGLELGNKSFREISVNTVCKLAWALSVGIESLFNYDVETAIAREQAWHKRSAGRKQKQGV
jgi:DNA-binding XRE family transcriptional regulator